MVADSGPCDALLSSEAVLLMGILNVTPDSFSDGGHYVAPDDALAQAKKMRDEGADIIDIGGESTRPGAQAVSVQQELDRVIPVIERIHAEMAIPISIDTSKPEVMQAAVAAGATMINDVRALRGPGALEAAVAAGVPVCLMHMQGRPHTMQGAPEYQDVVQDVGAFLADRMKQVTAAGIAEDQIVIDPGFGFGKTMVHNFTLLKGLASLSSLGRPILVGVSRKSMIGQALGLPVEQRLYASIALAMMAVQNGARIIRVHDVCPHRDAIRMMQAVQE